MKKRILCLFLVTLIVMTLMPTGALAYSKTGVGYKVTGGNIYISSDGYVVGCDETITEAIIPSYAWNIEVKEIYSYAFQNCKLLKNVTIPDSVTKIGQAAFNGCSQLESVKLGNGVVTIDGRAFKECVSLKEIIITDNVTSIGDSAFYKCRNLERVILGKNVQVIGDYAFYECSHLSELVIDKNIKVIGDVAFKNYSYNVIDNIYYEGSKDDWKQVNVGEDNRDLQNGSKFHYNYDPNHVHNYVEAVVAPTCRSRGFTTYTCSCGGNYKDNYTDALGHSYDNGKCIRCGAADPNYKPASSFVDVASTSYCYDAVQWAVDKGITNGTDATHFSPNAGCTRAQVVTFLWRAAGSPDVSANVAFVDVSESSVYYKAIKWAVANGITKGTDATHFSPNATCTRGQVVTFMYRAAGEPAVSSSGSFSDVVSGSYCYNAVQWAVANGITKGTDSTHFSPNATCTRGQVVTFLYRAQ